MADDKFRKVAGVPHIDSSIPQNIARVLTALKLNWELALAHARETGAGIFSERNDSLPLPPGLEDFIDTTVPPKPTNVRATGGFAVITLDWDVPRYGNHSHAEIWRAEADDLTAAKVIGQTPGSVFSDPVGNNKTYWYWVRFVSLSTITGPYHDVAGIQAKTALDPEYALDVLQGQITSSQLHSDLGQQIELIDVLDLNVADLIGKVDGPYTQPGTVAYRLAQESASLQEGIAAEVTARNVAMAQLDSDLKGLIAEERTARADADGAEATARQQLSTTVGRNSTAIEQQASSINGLRAQYTVKIDSNGYVSGFGLASEPVGSSPYSSFAVRADRFYIASPAGPGVAPTMPFIVQTTQTTGADGSVIPPGVYLRDVFIANGTIKRAKIGLGAIDEGRIADAAITRAKIADAAIDSAKIANIIQSNNYSSTTGWLINRDGTAYFNNLFARGTFQSSNYAAGAAGWRITNSGDAEFNTLKVRTGNLTGDLHQMYGISPVDPGVTHVSNAGDNNNWKTVYTAYMPPPSRGGQHKVAANFCVYARANVAGIQDMDVRIVIDGEEVAYAVQTGQWNMSCTVVGASGARTQPAEIVVQVRGYAANYTVMRVSGVIWTID